MCAVTFDESLVLRVDTDRLPKTWRKDPPPRALQGIGDEWIARATSAVLQVPSAIVTVESNFLLNPAHPDVAKVTIGPHEPFRFDRRLLS